MMTCSNSSTLCADSKLGRIYQLPKNSRSYKVQLACLYAGVSFEPVSDITFGQTNKSKEFLSKFPFGKFPSAETLDGPLFESNAIAYYAAAHSAEKLLGHGHPYRAACVQQFLSMADNEIVPAVSAVIYPLLGYASYQENEWKKAKENMDRVLTVLDSILLFRTYLVGDNVTLADIVMWTSVLYPFQLVLDASSRGKFVNLTRWFLTLANKPHFVTVLGGTPVKLCDRVVLPGAQKSEEKEKKQPVEKEPAHVPSTSMDVDEDAVPVSSKPKNPLDLLPPSKFNLEDWKRFYSNNDTRPIALNYFWDNFDRQGFSVWRADYKYNSELNKIFMTCNLVSGLFQRMEAVRKYCFATVLIFGEDNANEISGYFVFRGMEIPPEMRDVPDFESYDFRPVNLDDSKEKALFEDYLAWDGDLDGKKLNQGKTFK